MEYSETQGGFGGGRTISKIYITIYYVWMDICDA